MSDSSYSAERRIRECPAFVAIPFRPVPVKPRHDGWTAARQRGFIDRLVVTGCVALSARAVGKTPQSVYRLRDHADAASFRRAWDEALEYGESHMIDVAIARSLVGEAVPIMRDGRCVGEIRRYDNRVAMAALKAMDRRSERGEARDPVLVLDRYLDAVEAGGGDAASDAGPERYGLSGAIFANFVNFWGST